MAADVRTLKRIEDLDEVLAAPGALLLFKHSTACPISAGAHRRFHEWLETADPAPRVAMVHVIEERPVSNEIERRLGVRHESPQVLLVESGGVVWHASHQAITAEALTEAVRKLVPRD